MQRGIHPRPGLGPRREGHPHLTRRGAARLKRGTRLEQGCEGGRQRLRLIGLDEVRVGGVAGGAQDVLGVLLTPVIEALPAVVERSCPHPPATSTHAASTSAVSAPRLQRGSMEAMLLKLSATFPASRSR